MSNVYGNAFALGLLSGRETPFLGECLYVCVSLSSCCAGLRHFSNAKLQSWNKTCL